MQNEQPAPFVNLLFPNLHDMIEVHGKILSPLFSYFKLRVCIKAIDLVVKLFFKEYIHT